MDMVGRQISWRSDENFGRTASRPLLLIVALFCALAIGLTGVYALRSQSAAPNVGITKPFPFVQDRPGPDSHSRNLPAAVQSPDPWANVGK